MAKHRTGTREELLKASKELHGRQQELANKSAQLTEERRNLPWVRIDKQYELETENGTRSFADLFDGRSQLLVYHMMFGPSWTAACPACSTLVDHLDPMLPHLNGNDVTMVVVSHAPADKLARYRRRMGWKVECLSSHSSDFNYDFGASFTGEQQSEIANQVLPAFEGNAEIERAATSCGIGVAEYITTEAPGLDSFLKDEDGTIFHTFTSVPEGGLELGFVQFLDRAPRPDADGLTMLRHDEY